MALAASYVSMLDEFTAAGEPYHQKNQQDAHEDIAGLLRRWEERRNARNLKPGQPAATNYWLVRDGAEVVGSGRVRHWLTEATFRCAGHVGYDIRPSARGRGYATLLCGLLLDEARKMGIVRALLTCNGDNYASIRVIEKNSGRYHSTIQLPQGRNHMRFWVDLARP
ncbi:MAG: GNAT family N-acetyltransferase [Phycisphaerae bacterium]